MKFYNPFKPHIIEKRGRFWIRKRVILGGWMYLDDLPMSLDWFNMGLIADSFSTHEEASIKLSALDSLIKKNNEFNKVKVHV
jgi:hypothetical protein